MKAILLSSLILFGSTSAHALEVTGTLEDLAEVPVLGEIIGTTAIPTLLTAMTSGYECKEIALAVKADAQDFLAGEEATNALVKTVDLLKTTVPELSQASSEEIVKMIATLE